MKYADIVDYDKLDPFKQEAIRRFRETLKYPNRFGMRIIKESVGETAVVLEADFLKGVYLAFNVEGLGTKNIVAESMAEKERIGQGLGISRRKLFAGLGQDVMAMSLNDLGAVGGIPVVYGPIVALGSNDYLVDEDIRNGLLDGFVGGAEIAHVAIPGGETPTLRGIVYPTTMDLAGASIGIVPITRLCLGRELRAGLLIYGVGSSGIHANGLSLARAIAEKSPQGYFTKLPSGKTIGEALLTATILYSPLVEALNKEKAEIEYMQPITGHGWAKIMRKKKDLTYVIEHVPEPQEEFRFLDEQGAIGAEELYKTFNMGVGWVLFAPANNSAKIRRACEICNLSMYELGHIEHGPREVRILSIDVTYRPH